MLNFSLFAIVAFSIKDLDVDITKAFNVMNDSKYMFCSFEYGVSLFCLSTSKKLSVGVFDSA